MVARYCHGLLILAAGFGLVESAAAQAPADSLPAGVTEAMVAAGRRLFGAGGLCHACHGADAKGLIGPDLTDGTWLHGTGAYPEIVARVLSGVSADSSKSGQVMPPRGGSSLNDVQVRMVAAYVWSLRGAAGSRGKPPGG